MPRREAKRPTLEVGQIWEGMTRGRDRSRREIVAIEGIDLRWKAVGNLSIEREGITRVKTFRVWAKDLIRRVGR